MGRPLFVIALFGSAYLVSTSMAGLLHVATFLEEEIQLRTTRPIEPPFAIGSGARWSLKLVRDKPVVANTDADVKRHANIEYRGHGITHQCADRIDFFARNIKQQFVMDL